MCLLSDGRKVPRIYDVSEGYRSQPKQDLGHNRDGTPEEREKSTKPQQQNSNAKQVRVKDNEQMFAFLQHVEEIL